MKMKIIPKVGPIRFNGSIRINRIISEKPAIIKNAPSIYDVNATTDSP